MDHANSVPKDWSPFGYIPNLAANTVACVLFFVILVVQLVLGLKTRDWWMLVTWGITAALEIAGYVGRAVAHRYPATYQLFELQLVCCIIAPAFMAAGLYYQLGKQITIYGEQYSPYKPMIYTAVFATFDVISLIVQACGGSIAAANVLNKEWRDKGGWIMVGGIGVQVLTLLIFMIHFAIINWRIFRDDPKNWNPEFAHTRKRPLFPFLLPAICISLVFLMTRSAYRIVELSKGWTGYLMDTERYFLILDGLMIVLGMAPLCIIYPGLAYGYVPVRGLNYKDYKRGESKTENKENIENSATNEALDRRSSSETLRTKRTKNNSV